MVFDCDFSNDLEALLQPGNKHLEIELQAAGMQVDGEKRVRLNPLSPLPPTIWNCSFSSTGEQAVNLAFNMVTAASISSPETRDVIANFETKVYVKGALSAAALPAFTLFLSIASTAAAVIQVVLKPFG